MALYVVPSLFLGTRYSIFQNFLVFLRIFLVNFFCFYLCHKSVWCCDIDKVSFRPFLVAEDRLRTRISINNIRDIYFVSRQLLRILLRIKIQQLVEPCMIQTTPHPKMIILSLSKHMKDCSNEAERVSKNFTSLTASVFNEVTLRFPDGDEALLCFRLLHWW